MREWLKKLLASDEIRHACNRGQYKEAWSATEGLGFVATAALIQSLIERVEELRSIENDVIEHVLHGADFNWNEAIAEIRSLQDRLKKAEAIVAKLLNEAAEVICPHCKDTFACEAITCAKQEGTFPYCSHYCLEAAEAAGGER